MPHAFLALAICLSTKTFAWETPPAEPVQRVNLPIGLPRPVPAISGFEGFNRGAVNRGAERSAVIQFSPGRMRGFWLPKAEKDGYAVIVEVCDDEVITLNDQLFRADVGGDGNTVLSAVDPTSIPDSPDVAPHAYVLPLNGSCTICGESLSIGEICIDDGPIQVRLKPAVADGDGDSTHKSLQEKRLGVGDRMPIGRESQSSKTKQTEIQITRIVPSGDTLLTRGWIQFVIVE